jgi:hypothetical protein
MEYRADKNLKVWYFCPWCSKWPHFRFKLSLEKPVSGLELCDECLTRAEAIKWASDVTVSASSTVFRFGSRC